MNKIRLLLLVALTVNMLLVAWNSYGFHVVGIIHPSDDWVFKAMPQECKPEPINNFPWMLVGAWIAIEFLHRVLLGGRLAEAMVVVGVLAVLASVSGPMIGSITDQGKMSAERFQQANDLAMSVGGAKDVNTFRRNLDNGTLPRPSDVTFEGLYYDYTFDTGKADAPNAGIAGAAIGEKRLFFPTYSCAVSKHPLTGETERYLAVGLNSDLKESDFHRKKLNLVVVLDISGSMSSPFDRYYYDRFTGRRVKVAGANVAACGNGFAANSAGYKNAAEAANETDATSTKLEVACRSIVAVLDRLHPDDRFGMVLFDDSAYLAKSLRLLSATDLPAIRKHILELEPQGCTNMEDGMRMGIDLLKPYATANPEDWENRVIFLTDAMPNTEDTSEEGLLGLTRSSAKSHIYFSFVGIGIDFTTELIEAITKVRGANYCGVFSGAQFQQKLVEEFDFMVTPLLFDLALSVKADGYQIEKVYGTPEANQTTGELMRVNTLFPTRTIDGEAKGGLVLLKLRQTGDSPKLFLEASCEDRSGKVIANRSEVVFPTGDGEKFDNSGIRKGVLLTRYGQLLKDWLSTENMFRQASEVRQKSAAGLGIWERPSQALAVDAPWGSRIQAFLGYYRQERQAIGDSALMREESILEKLAQWPVYGG